MEGRQKLLQNILGTYLDQTGSSLSSLADKLQMSKSHLSDIKNGKAKAGVDLGLKILKSCGANLETRRDWFHIYMCEEIPEYQELQQSLINNWHEKYLPREMGDQMANNIDVMHILLDIIEEKELGLSLQDIKIRYGSRGKEWADWLVEGKLITQRHDRYYSDDKRLVLSKYSSYSFLENIFREQREKYLNNNYEGRFEFQVDDINETILGELFQLHKEYVRKVAETIKKIRHLDKNQKSKRVIVQALCCVLRNNLFSIILIFMFSIFLMKWVGWLGIGSDAWARDGGLGGGSNSTQAHVMRLSGYKKEKLAIEAGAQVEDLINNNKGEDEKIKKIGESQCARLENGQSLEKTKIERYLVERYFSDQQEFFDLIVHLKFYCKESNKSGWNNH